ncbi:MAG: hypothetical protein QM706_04845 [Nitrospira sp.]
MIQSKRTRKEPVTRVGIHVRQMGAQSVLTSQAVVVRFGLHTTDLEWLDLIDLRESLSAGHWRRRRDSPQKRLRR